ncbi:hypothetical protein HRbin10_02423 [bacterium HR10]|nr:hypothetical protein HRbin10_02423 [bacterium HR10]
MNGRFVDHRGEFRAFGLDDRRLGRDGDGLGHRGDLQRQIHGSRPADEHGDPRLRHRREAGHLGRHLVRARRQKDEPIPAGSIRRGLAHGIGPHVARAHLRTGDDSAPFVADDAFDRPGRLRLRAHRPTSGERKGYAAQKQGHKRLRHKTPPCSCSLASPEKHANLVPHQADLSKPWELNDFLLVRPRPTFQISGNLIRIFGSLPNFRRRGRPTPT